MGFWIESPCTWDQTEIVLKASVVPRDQPFAVEWTTAYEHAFMCFPRLHIVTDNASKVSPLFQELPNATVHELVYPAMKQVAEFSNIKLHGLPILYFLIQWPFMWADNLTTASHLLILDTDSLPSLPLRCHQLFGNDRPLWHTWLWPSPVRPAWLPHVNALVEAAYPGGLSRCGAIRDYMTFFPVAIPRQVPLMSLTRSHLA